MLLLALLVGCGPGLAPLAVSVCEALPGLSIDAPARQILADKVVAEELLAWDQQTAMSPGMMALSLKGYGVIRASSACRVEAIEGNAVTVVRSEPEVNPASFVIDEVADLPHIDRPQRLSVVDGPDGQRLAVGLLAAQAKHDAALALVAEDRVDEAILALTALHVELPDPGLLFLIETLRTPPPAEPPPAEEVPLEEAPEAQPR
ncbi:MAG: hypothetical protein IPO67_07635 [Deltaproteobacteria bacterium]|nr:hypothetical protein [Deltaproteobacteria bacterium]